MLVRFVSSETGEVLMYANVAKVLTDTFGIAGIGTVEEDLNRFFG